MVRQAGIGAGMTSLLSTQFPSTSIESNTKVHNVDDVLGDVFYALAHKRWFNAHDSQKIANRPKSAPSMHTGNLHMRRRREAKKMHMGTPHT